MIEKRISQLAKNYANSLFEADNNYERILSNLLTVSDVIENSSEFASTMLNPAVSLNVKFDIIDEIFKKELSAKVLNFIKIIVEKNRFGEFNQIMSAYKDLLDNVNNTKKVEIVSAIELSDNQKQNILEKLSSKFNKNITPNWIIDKSIIAGLVIKLDDNVIDTSVKNKLKKLSRI